MDTIAEISYWYNLILTYLTIGITWLFDQFRDFAWVVRIAAISLTVSVWLILSTMFRIFRRAWKRRKWNKIEKRLKEKYLEGVEFVLSNNAPQNMTRDDILELLGIQSSDSDPTKLLKDWKERMCMSRIIYRARISEDAQVKDSRNLQLLLRIFGIIVFLEEVVLKDQEHLKAEAMMMLRSFKVQTNQWIANQLKNSKKKRVKRMAMYANVMTSSNTDLAYFESDFFKENFNMYDEIQLGFVLQSRLSAKRKIPNLAHWATLQTDPRAQAIFIRMMRHFNQKDFCEELEEMFNHNADTEIIEEIARTWGYLKYTQGEETLRDMMLTQPDRGKVAIMHALTRMGTGNSLGTLIDGYRNSGSPHVKFEALRCIYLYGDAGKAKYGELKAQATEQEKRYFAFFENPLTMKDIPLEATAHYHSRYGDNLFSVA